MTDPGDDMEISTAGWVAARAPYTVRFIGGVLHGETATVHSLAPLRAVRHRVRPSIQGRLVVPAWDGRSALAGKCDIYEFDGMAAAEQVGPSYTYKRTVGG